MATHVPADVLLAHDRWATRSLLEAARSLPREQFHQRFDMGLGSLHDTFLHILSVSRGWTDMLQGRMQPPATPRPRLEDEGEKTAGDLLALLDPIADEFEEAVRAHPLDALATGDRGGRTFSFPRGVILTHVTTHHVHHRAQGLNMLRRLGVDPLPRCSVIEWQLQTAPSA